MITIQNNRGSSTVDWTLKANRSKLNQVGEVERSEDFKLDHFDGIDFVLFFYYDGGILLAAHPHLPDELNLRLYMIRSNNCKAPAPIDHTDPQYRHGEFDVAEFEAHLGADDTVRIQARIGIKKGSDDDQDGLEKMYTRAFEDETRADVKLIANDGELVMASKFVLAANSTVFKAMFCEQFTEKDAKEVVIPDVASRPLRTLVRYMYDRSLELKDVEHAIEVLYAADKYDLQQLKLKCGEYVSDYIGDDNVLSILEVVDQLHLNVLFEECIDFLSVKSADDLKKVSGWSEYSNPSVLRALVASRPVIL